MRRRFAIAVALCLAAPGIHALWAATSSKSDKAEHLSSYRWQLQQGWFGGFSGLIVADNGLDFLTISDRGYFVEGRFQREAGLLSAITQVRQARVVDANGAFARRAGLRDSEGLAILPDGSVAVTFEGEHRIESFAEIGARPKKLPWFKGFDEMKLNGGFEALAIDNQGVLYAIPEQPTGADAIVQVFALQGQNWQRAFTLKRDKQFQPVGADFGSDGRLYVLERGFNGLGFRTRVRSFAISDAGATDGKIIFHKGIGGHDNLEGLSVWLDDEGHIRLTMISDDNFRLVQRTEFVEYRLPK